MDRQVWRAVDGGQAMNKELCKERIFDGFHAYDCGRPTKGEHGDKKLCGIHLAAARKREASNLRWKIEREAEERASVEGRDLAGKITAMAYGLPARYSGQPGIVMVDGWKLLALLKGADPP